MNSYLPAVFAVLAYLLGSIPTAVWVSRMFFRTDIRDHGSGNAGATNTIRVLGWKAGLPVMVIDVSKAILAVLMVRLIPWVEKGSDLYYTFESTYALLAIIGHILPVFAGFRGGKGVATVFGAMLIINFPATLISFLVFALAIAFTRYVSLGSMLAGITFPIAVILVLAVPHLSFQIFSILVPVIIIVTHRKNLGRLLKGEERKFEFRKKKQE